MKPDSLENNIIFLCGEFSHLFHHALTAMFKKHRIPVSVEQFSILALLFYKNGINQQEISGLLNRDKTTVARVIVKMEKSKLIVRMTDRKDNRGKLIYLTDEGERVQEKAVECSAKLYHRAIRNLKPPELKTSLKVMTRMLKNVK